MKITSVWSLCMAMLLANVTFGGAPQVVLAHAKLVRTSTNANGLVVTKFTEKDIIAECASKHPGVNLKDLKFMLVGDGFYVVDMATTNILCPFLYVSGGCITQAAAVACSSANSNIINLVVLDSVTAPTNGMLEADLEGSVVNKETLTRTLTGIVTTVPSAPSKIALSMALQAGSASNDCVYTGTIKANGKIIGFR